MMNMIRRLSELADIQAGYPFRGSITHLEHGPVRVVQPKDISDLGELRSEQLVRTDLAGKKSPNFLQSGDILFIAKGLRNIACCITESLECTTSSPSLFHIRVKPEFMERVDPQFIAWQLNQKPAQTYFRKGAEGSTQINIRKPVLAEVELGVPCLEKQIAIAKFHQASVKEHALLEKLIHNRQQQNHAIANDLLRTNHKK